MAFPEADVGVLRDLAARVAEIAALPVQEERAEMWRRHNRLEHGRPLVGLLGIRNCTDLLGGVTGHA